MKPNKKERELEIVLSPVIEFLKERVKTPAEEGLIYKALRRVADNEPHPKKYKNKLKTGDTVSSEWVRHDRYETTISIDGDSLARRIKTALRVLFKGQIILRWVKPYNDEDKSLKLEGQPVYEPYPHDQKD